MKQLYLIRDKQLKIRWRSKNNPDPLHNTIEADQKVPYDSFSPSERDYWLSVLEEQGDVHGSKHGELIVKTDNAEQALTRLNLFLPWFRRFHEPWEVSIALRTVGLRGEIREE